MILFDKLPGFLSRIFKDPLEKVVGKDNAWIVYVVFEIALPFVVGMLRDPSPSMPLGSTLGIWLVDGLLCGGTIAAAAGAVTVVGLRRYVRYQPPRLSVRSATRRIVAFVAIALVAVLFSVMDLLAVMVLSNNPNRVQRVNPHAVTLIAWPTYVVVIGGTLLFLTLTALGLRLGRRTPGRYALWPPLRWRRIRGDLDRSM